jgi:Uma2 family endonuclease
MLHPLILPETAAPRSVDRLRGGCAPVRRGAAQVRAADAAVWKDAARAGEGFARLPPVLAVEVAGVDDAPEDLLEKARWYIAHGVETVWIVLPQTRAAKVVTGAGIVDVGGDERLPEPACLPGLSPRLADFFRQLE